MLTAHTRREGALAAALVAASLLSSIGCAGVRMELEPLLPSCRTTSPPDAPVRWLTPFDADDRKNHRAWCEPVGPVSQHDPRITLSQDRSPLIVVSWNMAVGAGSLVDLVNDTRRPDGGVVPQMVLLIQEAYRTGDVPHECPSNSGVADRLGPPRESTSADILDLARRLALYAAYVPSMRNGADCAAEPREDRGNAILSTLPISDIVAVELPFAQQRRVAVGATIRPGGRALHVISVHFDTLRGHKRQAQALWQSIGTLGWQDRVVIGGDFNARVFDPGVREMKRNFTEADCGTGPTHENGLRLDRVFTRGLAASLQCETGSGRFGSDHHPLVARVPIQ